jgi:PKD repeat protein
MRSLILTIFFLAGSLGLFATTEKKELQLTLRAQYGSYDQTTIYFDLGVSPVYNAAEDAEKVMITLPGVPNIYTMSSDNVKCEINGYSPLTQSAVIGIGVLLDSAALYTFTLTQFHNFDSTTLVILEDRQLHVFTEMQTNFYQAQLTPQDTSGRFFLHITKAVQFNPVTAGCSNNNGAISVISDSSVTWNTVSLLDSTGATIASYNNAQGQFAFNNLGEGTYQLAFNYNSYSISKSVFVNGTHVVVSITASPSNVMVGETIDFTSSAINTTEYVWQFGDSSYETGVANPTYFYYAPGVYTVTLTCSNAAGCSAQTQTTITVNWPTGINSPFTKEISVINLGAKTVQIIMNNIELNNVELLVYNILGQTVYTAPVTANEMLVSLTNEPSGIYLVSIKHAGKISTTKIYIN